MSGSLAHELLAKLEEFDGRAVTILGEIESEHGAAPGYLDCLIEAVGRRRENTAAGATWLIKSALEKGECLSCDQIDAFLAAGLEVEGWAAQLHICQSAHHLEFAEQQAPKLAAIAIPLLISERPFLRAWSLDALGVLASQHKAFEKEFERALADGLEDPAASVRARARQLKRQR